jgi:2-polyprenyl-3-methyl-5-hydroxy-6-metoxy-1,4-benzoquinol methylase
MASTFDFQWKKLPDKNIEYCQERINEFLRFTNIPDKWFDGKTCIDIGCGNGRYTYAMQSLGGVVTSIDYSDEAVNACKKINKNTFKQDILSMKIADKFDFVLSWGVLHHTSNPYKAFINVSNLVKKDGVLHIMLYHKDTQKQYEIHRELFKKLRSEKDKLEYIYKIGSGKNIHGWWDALSPDYNFSFTEDEVIKMFVDAGFKDIKIVTKYNININAVKL